MQNNNMYIIGDVHGCIKTLKALIEQLPNKYNENICFVGDLIDRGKNSRDVVDLVINNNYDCILGNHELAFIDSVPEIIENKILEETNFWLNRCGGYSTMLSYKNSDDSLDKDTLLKHLDYFKSLPHFKEYKHLNINNRYLLVTHSHVYNKWIYKDYPKDSNEYNSFLNSILYSRYKNFDNNDIFNVYGHTAFDKPVINEFKAGIDLGCVYKKETLDGKLCALEFPSLKTFVQENIELDVV